MVYDIEQHPYQSTFYNGTIEVTEAGGFVSVESVFLFSLGVALLVLLALWVHSQIQRLSKVLCIYMHKLHFMLQTSGYHFSVYVILENFSWPCWIPFKFPLYKRVYLFLRLTWQKCRLKRKIYKLGKNFLNLFFFASFIAKFGSFGKYTLSSYFSLVPSWQWHIIQRTLKLSLSLKCYWVNEPIDSSSSRHHH